MIIFEYVDWTINKSTKSIAYVRIEGTQVDEQGYLSSKLNDFTNEVTGLASRPDIWPEPNTNMPGFDLIKNLAKEQALQIDIALNDLGVLGISIAKDGEPEEADQDLVRTFDNLSVVVAHVIRRCLGEKVSSRVVIHDRKGADKDKAEHKDQQPNGYYIHRSDPLPIPIQQKTIPGGKQNRAFKLLWRNHLAGRKVRQDRDTEARATVSNALVALTQRRLRLREKVMKAVDRYSASYSDAFATAGLYSNLVVSALMLCGVFFGLIFSGTLFAEDGLLQRVPMTIQSIALTIFCQTMTVWLALIWFCRKGPDDPTNDEEDEDQNDFAFYRWSLPRWGLYLIGALSYFICAFGLFFLLEQPALWPKIGVWHLIGLVLFWLLFALLMQHTVKVCAATTEEPRQDPRNQWRVLFRLGTVVLGFGIGASVFALVNLLPATGQSVPVIPVISRTEAALLSYVLLTIVLIVYAMVTRLQNVSEQRHRLVTNDQLNFQRVDELRSSRRVITARKRAVMTLVSAPVLLLSVGLTFYILPVGDPLPSAKDDGVTVNNGVQMDGSTSVACKTEDETSEAGINATAVAAPADAGETDGSSSVGCETGDETSDAATPATGDGTSDADNNTNDNQNSPDPTTPEDEPLTSVVYWTVVENIGWGLPVICIGLLAQIMSQFANSGSLTLIHDVTLNRLNRIKDLVEADKELIDRLTKDEYLSENGEFAKAFLAAPNLDQAVKDVDPQIENIEAMKGAVRSSYLGRTAVIATSVLALLQINAFAKLAPDEPAHSDVTASDTPTVDPVQTTVALRVNGQVVTPVPLQQDEGVVTVNVDLTLKADEEDGLVTLTEGDDGFTLTIPPPNVNIVALPPALGGGLTDGDVQVLLPAPIVPAPMINMNVAAASEQTQGDQADDTAENVLSAFPVKVEDGTVDVWIALPDPTELRLTTTEDVTALQVPEGVEIQEGVASLDLNVSFPPQTLDIRAGDDEVSLKLSGNPNVLTVGTDLPAYEISGPFVQFTPRTDIRVLSLPGLDSLDEETVEITTQNILLLPLFNDPVNAEGSDLDAFRWGLDLERLSNPRFNDGRTFIRMFAENLGQCLERDENNLQLPAMEDPQIVIDVLGFASRSWGGSVDDERFKPSNHALAEGRRLSFIRALHAELTDLGVDGIHLYDPNKAPIPIDEIVRQMNEWDELSDEQGTDLANRQSYDTFDRFADYGSMSTSRDHWMAISAKGEDAFPLEEYYGRSVLVQVRSANSAQCNF